ncbi:unnamed protein product [Periconia digitata]|uniref:Uncharacterized protein n=1 Tax=Periconia digitata TaxID=1303443 RepID=A0A9W4XPZ8_9PLEO|nr:unnamed protein product [Periconia digitata]
MRHATSLSISQQDVTRAINAGFTCRITNVGFMQDYMNITCIIHLVAQDESTTRL